MRSLTASIWKSLVVYSSSSSMSSSASSANSPEFSFKASASAISCSTALISAISDSIWAISASISSSWPSRSSVREVVSAILWSKSLSFDDISTDFPSIDSTHSTWSTRDEVAGYSSSWDVETRFSSSSNWLYLGLNSLLSWASFNFSRLSGRAPRLETMITLLLLLARERESS